jgi:DNA invertase Pin-like site-specific DNA recombinase
VGGHDNPARALDADRLRRAGRVEKELIRARTTEGRERAKARGVKLGRKPKMTEHQKREAIRHRDRDGEIVREITRSYNVSHSTISRLTV